MITHTFANGAILTINANCLEVMPALTEASIDMIFADLPYGTTDCKWDTPIDLARFWPEINRIGKPRAAQVLTATNPFSATLVTSNIKRWRHSWVWNKKITGNFATAKYRPLTITEDIHIFSVEAPHYYPIMITGKMRTKGGEYKTATEVTGGIKMRSVSVNDQYYPKNIIEIGNADRRNRIHRTQKPIDLLIYLIETYSRPGDLILDPTAGSGTTAIAAYRSGRRAIVIEQDPKIYADMLGHIGANI